MEQGGPFEAIDVNGTCTGWRGKKLILATGVVDVYPDIDGYGDCWVRAIFHCLFCHGPEERDRPEVAVYSPSDHLHERVEQLSDDLVTALGGGRAGEEIKVDSRVVKRLEGRGDPALRRRQPAGRGLPRPQTEVLDLPSLRPASEASSRLVMTAGDDGSPIKVANNGLFTGAAVGAAVAAQLQADNLGHKGMFPELRVESLSSGEPKGKKRGLKDLQDTEEERKPSKRRATTSLRVGLRDRAKLKPEQLA
ncbi:MAG: hypothetical protein M1816_005918 [Peltula sp. TS41687]|nr:MAG: hypothetical protein M1816_005918 [Peltula sp. TS41687]